MTREEKQKAIDALKTSAPVMAVTQEEFNDYIKTLNKIMDWLEQEPCEDAISRQAAIDTIENWLSCDDYNETERHIMRAMRSVLYDLPSVTPQPKKPQENDHKCHTCKHYTSGEHDGSCGSYICKGYSNWESEDDKCPE